MVTECPVIKLRKFSDAALDTGADGSRPENALLAKSQVPVAALCQEFLDLRIRGAGKEKNIVEVALPGKFGLPLWQTHVLHKFAGREGAQSYNGHAGVMGKCLQSISRCGQGFRDGNAREAPEPHRRGLPGATGVGVGPLMEIALRQINRAALFCD